MDDETASTMFRSQRWGEMMNGSKHCVGLLAVVLSSVSLACGNDAGAPAVVWPASEVNVEQISAAGARGPALGLFLLPLNWFTESLGNLVAIYHAGADHWFTNGYGVVVGHWDATFPGEDSFTVATYGRSGNSIQIVLTHHPSGRIAPTGLSPATESTAAYQRIEPPGEKSLFFGARLPHDLPDGHYTITATIVDENGHQAAEAPPLRLSYDLPVPKEDDVEQRRITAMTDDELLKQYVQRAEALRGTGLEPVERGSLTQAAYPYQDPRRVRWESVRTEMIARAGRLVPKLIELLNAELQRNGNMPADQRETAFGLANDLLDILARIHDGRAAPILIEVLGGFGGKADLCLQQEAYRTLEAVTYVAVVHQPGLGVNSSALPTPDAENEDWNDLFEKDPHPANQHARAAAKYRAWLNAHPDPTRFADLARTRALELLKSENADDVYCACFHLWSAGAVERESSQSDVLMAVGCLDGAGVDDSSSPQVLARIAEILNECRPMTGEHSPWNPRFSWRGKELPRGVNVWIGLAAAYGPRARTIVPTVLKIHSAAAEEECVSDLMGIGGEAAMAHLVERLPFFRAQCEAAKLDVKTSLFGSSAPFDKRQLLMNYQDCRWAIERWFGRVLASDSDIDGWWKLNAKKTQEQWLAESLELTAGNADAGDPESQYLIRLLLPALPAVEGEQPWDPPTFQRGNDYRVLPIPPFRVKWVQEHHANLIYNENEGCFRLPPATTRRG